MSCCCFRVIIGHICKDYLCSVFVLMEWDDFECSNIMADISSDLCYFFSLSRWFLNRTDSRKLADEALRVGTACVRELLQKSPSEQFTSLHGKAF